MYLAKLGRMAYIPIKELGHVRFEQALVSR